MTLQFKQAWRTLSEGPCHGRGRENQAFSQVLLSELLKVRRRREAKSLPYCSW